MKYYRRLEGNINPSRINVNHYVGMKISELVALVPHDYRIRVLTSNQRPNERLTNVTGSNTLNVVVDEKRQRIIKVLGYYN